MNFSVVKLQEIDAPVYFENLYTNKKLDKSERYVDQHTKIKNLYIGYSARSFLKNFQKLGNQAEVIFWNAEFLQKKWAIENGIKFDEKNWKKEILIAQLKKIKPEVLYFQNLSSLDLQTRKNIKTIVPSIKKVVIHIGYPGTYKDLSYGDILFINSPVLIERYNYLKPHFLYHSFDEEIVNLPYFKDIKKNFKLGFVGGLRFPESRYFFVKRLHEKFNLNVWGNFNRNFDHKVKNNTSIFKKILFYFVKRFLNLGVVKKCILLINPKKINSKILEILNADSLKKSSNSIIPNVTQEDIEKEDFKFTESNNFHKSVYGLDYFKVIKQTEILVNKHADRANIILDNIKMFEITGMGSCLVSNYGSNLKDIFEEGSEIVTYKTMPEAEEKIKYLINNPKVAEEIAIKGQKRTLKDHTSSIRNIEIEKIIKNNL